MAYTQKNNPFPVTSCGRRRTFTQGGEPGNDRTKESPFEQSFDIKSEKKKNKRNWKSTEPRKTTKGKDRNFRTTEEGAGMTQKGVNRYKAKNPGSKLGTAVTGEVKAGSKDAKRRTAFCARSKGWDGERGKAARARWKC
jgi:hypothetical protein